MPSAGVAYAPWIEPEAGAGKGLLRELAGDACAVVTDGFPSYFLPRMLEAAAEQVPVRLEAVDSNGILPLRAADKVFARAFDFRRFVQKNLLEHLPGLPLEDPLSDARLPELDDLPQVLRDTPDAAAGLLDGDGELSDLPIDHDVPPSSIEGGSVAAEERLRHFASDALEHYADESNYPDGRTTSGLSPYLHFGHVSSADVFRAVVEHEEWDPSHTSDTTRGQREGWWGMSPSSEAFLDQLVTWRELGYNFCAHRDDTTEYESLPDWARATLAEHAGDPRPALYSLEEFEQAKTHDPLWNAAQNQLLRLGVIHNSVRMLWGKKILHWSESPREALRIMLALNDRWALDGRNPNSYSGIFWVLGRYDRPWGPEREVFGKIRYMTSESSRRKWKTDAYVKRWNEGSLF